MRLLSRLFATQPDPREAVRPLWHAVVAEARRPAWYHAGVADTVPGRFDAICAVLAAVLVRMERSEGLIAPSVHLTELFVEDMDGQLREFGVGDVVVGKHVGKLMSAMGGRVGAYRAALASDGAALAEAVRRNMTITDTGSAEAIADELRGLHARLSALPDDAILSGSIAA